MCMGKIERYFGFIVGFGSIKNMMWKDMLTADANTIGLMEAM